MLSKIPIDIKEISAEKEPIQVYEKDFQYRQDLKGRCITDNDYRDDCVRAK